MHALMRIQTVMCARYALMRRQTVMCARYALMRIQTAMCVMPSLHFGCQLRAEAVVAGSIPTVNLIPQTAHKGASLSELVHY